MEALEHQIGEATGELFMHVELEAQDIEALLDSIKYTLERVQNAAGIPYEERQQKLTRLEVVENKLRHITRAIVDQPGALSCPPPIEGS